MAATYSPTMQRSTIGDAELNDPVRNGKGWDLSAITTLIKLKVERLTSKELTSKHSTQPKGLTHQQCKSLFTSNTISPSENLYRKRFRAISTARLYVTIVHLQPINVVVYNDPQWKSNLGASFALRCFQRLSTPNAATRQCPWRDNRCTGGSSNTVLSY